MESIRHKPAAHWLLSDTAPFQDYSGYNRSATLSGTEAHGVSVNSYATFSQVFNASVTPTFAAPAYIAGKESESFTLVASVYYVAKSSAEEIAVLSNQNRLDGITMNGTVIAFSTKYVSNGEARCEYDIQTNRRVEVAGVHTKEKNSLYVDGVLVDEVDITPEQQADIYDAPNSNLYSGYGGSTNFILVNAVSVYNRALQSEELASIASANSRHSDGSVPKMFGGEEIVLSSETRAPYLNTGWFSEDDWNAATLSNVTTDGDDLVAMMESGLTMAGTWIDSIDLYTGPTPSTLTSANLWWEGENVTVEASVDGTTWATATRGANLSVIPSGFDPTNKALYIRVIFSSGEEEAWINSLRVHAYTSSTAAFGYRTITYSSTTPLNDYDGFEMREDSGVKIASGGSVSISADASSPVRTIEMWVKTTADMTYTTSGATFYQNGLLLDNNLKAGRWTLLHIVLGSDSTSAVTINGPLQVGRVALYPTALSAGDIAKIAANHTGVYTTQYDGTGIVSIAESPASTTVYAHDWEIAAS